MDPRGRKYWCLILLALSLVLNVFFVLQSFQRPQNEDIRISKFRRWQVSRIHPNNKTKSSVSISISAPGNIVSSQSFTSKLLEQSKYSEVSAHSEQPEQQNSPPRPKAHRDSHDIYKSKLLCYFRVRSKPIMSEDWSRYNYGWKQQLYWQYRSLTRCKILKYTEQRKLIANIIKARSKTKQQIIDAVSMPGTIILDSACIREDPIYPSEICVPYDSSSIIQFKQQRRHYIDQRFRMRQRLRRHQQQKRQKQLDFPLPSRVKILLLLMLLLLPATLQNDISQNITPINKPPAALATVPISDMPPLVPAGTSRIKKEVTSRGFTVESTPSSLAHVSGVLLLPESGTVDTSSSALAT